MKLKLEFRCVPPAGLLVLTFTTSSHITHHTLLCCCSGGLDILFGGQKELQVEVPAAADGQVRMHPNRSSLFQSITLPLKFLYLHAYLLSQPLTVRQLLPWTRDTLLQDRPELFMKGDTV